MGSELWLDLETRSTVDLRKATPYRYAADPEFAILMAAWTDDPERPVEVAIGRDEVDEIPGLFDPKVIKVAHNAPFERICLSAHAGLPTGSYLPVRQFRDTQALAGVWGWPQKLSMLARALGGEQKDDAGTTLINWFCKPDRNGNFRRPEDYPEKWTAFVEYCRQDVATLVSVDLQLPDFPTDMEQEVYFADQAINDRGLLIDTAMARRAVVAVHANLVEHEEELRQITGLSKPNNPVPLREWLTSQVTHNGKRLRMADLRAETVEARLAKLDEIGEPADSQLRRALELRQELAGTASKKFAAALDAVDSDDRLRGTLRYFGAHTGRWSGRGAQPQNLPGASFTKEDPETGKKVHDIDAENAAIFDLMMGLGGSPLTMKRLVRPLFIGSPDKAVVDYSSIEARVIAWLSGEEWALEAFRAGRDIYVETAERMGGLTRAQGKIAVLALGFGGSVAALRNMAGPSDDFINDQSDDQVRETLVVPWRRANPAIVRFWAELEEAFGHTGQAGRIRVTHSTDQLGRAVHMHLPSGRAIMYHGVKWETFSVPVDVKVRTKSGTEVTRTVWKQKQGYRYANPKDPFNARMRINTYGGRLGENATQAVARDFLAEALVRMERAGVETVGHVHDEALVHTSDLRTVEELMTVPPEWSEGMPLDAEGFICQRYRKG